MKVSMVGFFAFFFGCSVTPCDDNQTTDRNGFCVVGSTGGASGSPSTSPGGSDDAGAAGDPGSLSCAQASAFGDACATNADCHCEVDFCAVNPGASAGVCTRTGCLEDPSICPGAWKCLDLAVFSSDLPAICVPP